MSPTDKGANTPESNETPEPNGEPTPNEAAPVEPINEAPAEPEAAEAEATEPEATEPEAATPEAAPTEGIAPAGATYGEAPVAGTPLGGEYPAAEAFASAKAAPRGNKKVLAIIGAIVVAIAVVAVLLVVFLGGNDDSSPDAQIKQVTEDYVTAMNAGQLTKVPALLCEAQASQAPPGLTDQPAPAQQVKINSFDEIKVDGDKATATFTISDKNDDSIPSEKVPMVYVNENGWKLCQQ